MRELDTSNYYSYNELIDSMELDEVFSEHDNDYQGDSYYLFKRGDEFGILVFGWGSCSGCDALEAAYGNIEETTALRDDLYASIRWMSRDELKEWVGNKQWDSEWYYYREAGKDFIARLKAEVLS